MKAQVINTQICVKVDEYYVEICYYFNSNEITIIIDGKQFTCWHFNPSRLAFNYMNMIELATETVRKYKLRLAIQDGMTRAS